ncbi:MAG: TonB-dependent receptor [Spirosomataceae bacterium]
MRTFLLSVFLLFYFCDFTFAQKLIINGYVSDAVTGEGLIGATIYDTHSKVGTSTNKYGYFVFSLIGKNPKIVISFIGYETKILELSIEKDTTLHIGLSETSNILEEVVIKETESQKLQKLPLGVTNIPVSRLEKIPVLFGEADIIKALAMTPGVSTGNEGTAGLIVRGGSPDQNLILLDEATVYNTSHLFGLVSVFNPDAVKNVELYKAGFPARYGGRLSSVLDITMKEGNNQKHNQELTVGLISSKFLIEGPLSQKHWGKSSYMVSARSSYFTPFLLPNLIAFKLGKADQAFNYWLYDVNAKVNHKINDKSQVFLSLYHGNDFWMAQDGLSNNRGKFNLNWGNVTTSLRYNYIIQPKLFLKTIGTYSKYRYLIGSTSYEQNENKWQQESYFKTTSTIRDWTSKAFLEWFPNHFQQIRFGVDLTSHKFSPTNFESDILNENVNTSQQAYNAFEKSIFIENDIEILKKLKINTGFRAIKYSIQKQSYERFEPRITGNLILPYNFALKAGYSKMNQFIHLLSSSGAGLPNDIWVPATQNVRPSSSEQLSVGFTKAFPNNNIELTIEGYKKNFIDLIDYSDGRNFLSTFNTSWENQIERNGIGRVKGFEVFLNKTKGKFNGWIAYTLSKNERKFDNINDGNWFVANYDRRHSVAITGNYSPKNSKGSFSVSWVYQSGQPITVPIAIHEQFDEGQTGVLGYSIPIYGYRNNYRMPAYHRLDFSYTIERTTKKHHRDAKWIFGIYNVYNRVNPYYLKFKWQPYPYRNGTDKFTGIENRVYKVGVIPFLPFISYSVKLR